MQEDQFWMLSLPIWSHTIEDGDVEDVDNIQPITEKEIDIIKPTVVENTTKYGDIKKVDNIQPVVGKEIDIIKPAVVENSDSNLMVYSRRPRLPMQEQDPISLTHDQSSTPELSTFNRSNPSLLNHGFDTDIDIPIDIHNDVRNCIKHSLSNFLSYNRLCHQYKAFTTHLSLDSVCKSAQEALSSDENFHKFQ